MRRRLLPIRSTTWLARGSAAVSGRWQLTGYRPPAHQPVGGWVRDAGDRTTVHRDDEDRVLRGTPSAHHCPVRRPIGQAAADIMCNGMRPGAIGGDNVEIV